MSNSQRQPMSVIVLLDDVAEHVAKLRLERDNAASRLSSSQQRFVAKLKDFYHEVTGGDLTKDVHHS